MNEQAFELMPFSADDTLSNLKIEGFVSRDRNFLKIRYSLVDVLDTVVIPPSVNEPRRKHRLWEETCFEFFLGVENTSKYWEFNLSPARHWNIYRFDDYRQGMQEEAAIVSLPFTVEETVHSLLLVLELNLDQLVPADRKLEMAISTVIKTKDSAIGYWALTHPSAQADFHRRDSFAILL